MDLMADYSKMKNCSILIRDFKSTCNKKRARRAEGVPMSFPADPTRVLTAEEIQRGREDGVIDPNWMALVESGVEVARGDAATPWHEDLSFWPIRREQTAAFLARQCRGISEAGAQAWQGRVTQADMV
jgi:hypothetical protein